MFVFSIAYLHIYLVKKEKEKGDQTPEDSCEYLMHRKIRLVSFNEYRGSVPLATKFLAKDTDMQLLSTLDVVFS